MPLQRATLFSAAKHAAGYVHNLCVATVYFCCVKPFSNVVVAVCPSHVSHWIALLCFIICVA